jgi:hypothetical protein
MRFEIELCAPMKVSDLVCLLEDFLKGFERYEPVAHIEVDHDSDGQKIVITSGKE